MKKNTSSQDSTSNSETEGGVLRSSYEAPRVLSAEKLEVAAKVCPSSPPAAIDGSGKSTSFCSVQGS